MAATLKADAAYLELIQRFPLRPIRREQDNEAALVVVAELMDSSRLSKAATDYLDVLSRLIEEYETKAHPIPPAGDGEVLSMLMDQHDETATALAKATGIVNTTISAVLRGKRTLTRNQIASIATHYGVSPSAFFAA